MTLVSLNQINDLIANHLHGPQIPLYCKLKIQLLFSVLKF